MITQKQIVEILDNWADGAEEGYPVNQIPSLISQDREELRKEIWQKLSDANIISKSQVLSLLKNQVNH